MDVTSAVTRNETNLRNKLLFKFLLPTIKKAKVDEQQMQTKSLIKSIT